MKRFPRLGSTATLALALLAAPPAHAEQKQRFTVLEENDSLPFGSDKHYTQGIRLSYLGPEVPAESSGAALFDAADALLPWMAGGETRTRRYALLLGQSLFTPKETDFVPPDRRDRPYGAWLYGGVSLLQERDGRILDHIELQVGVVGPVALGKPAQNEWHQFIGISEAEGWGSQIQNEPGVVLEVERKWRLGLLGGRSFGVDVVPGLGAAVGNVFTYGKTGALIRVGTNLGADYGPVRITPALSGTDYVDTAALAPGLGAYFFVGAEGRLVGRNVFLDGNSFRSSRSVDRNLLVADLQAGVSVFWSDVLRLDVSAMRRTEEFQGQEASDILGTVALSVFW